jgi:hypothetical protein
MEAFRSVLKHFEQMFNPEVTWVQVRPILEKTEEFQALNDEEQRIEAFNKFKDRLKVFTSLQFAFMYKINRTFSTIRDKSYCLGKTLKKRSGRE